MAIAAGERTKAVGKRVSPKKLGEELRKRNAAKTKAATEKAARIKKKADKEGATRTRRKNEVAWTVRVSRKLHDELKELVRAEKRSANRQLEILIEQAVKEAQAIRAGEKKSSVDGQTLS